MKKTTIILTVFGLIVSAITIFLIDKTNKIDVEIAQKEVQNSMLNNKSESLKKQCNNCFY